MILKAGGMALAALLGSLSAAMAAPPVGKYFKVGHTLLGGIAKEGEVVRRDEIEKFDTPGVDGKPGKSTLKRLLRTGAIEPMYEDQGKAEYEETVARRRLNSINSGDLDDDTDDADDLDFDGEDDIPPLTVGSDKPAIGVVKPIEAHDTDTGVGPAPEKLTGNNAVPGVSDAEGAAIIDENTMPDSAAPVSGDGYESKTVEQLKGIALSLDVPNAANLKKGELIAGIRKAEKG